MSFINKVIIREYQDGDETQINALYNQEYDTNRNALEWRWEFLDGPYGKAIFIVAEYEGKIIGTQALLPMYLSWKGQPIFTAKSEEILVAKEFRGRGLSAKLWGKCWELAVPRGIVLSWAFGRQVIASVRGGGFQVIGKLNHAFLILNPSQAYQLNRNRIPPKVTKYFPFQAIPLMLLRAFIITGFCWGKIRRISRRPPSGFEVVILTQADSKLNSFWHSFSQETKTLTLARTSNYLNWRVFHNPHLHSELLTAVKDGEIQGYVILSKSKHQNVGSVTDFCVRDKYFNDTARLLMTQALEYFRSQGVAYVDAWYINSNREAKKYSSSLKSLGFLTIPKPSSVMLKLLVQETDIPLKPTDIKQWFITMLFSQGIE
jgi:GNAT superfamily N-acetyltransferase